MAVGGRRRNGTGMAEKGHLGAAAQTGPFVVTTWPEVEWTDEDGRMWKAATRRLMEKEGVEEAPDRVARLGAEGTGLLKPRLPRRSPS